MKQRLEKITEKIKAYKNITLVAVTKGRTVEEIETAFEQGIHDIGESYLQEAEGKLPKIQLRLTKHFIGRLQSNKIKRIVKLFDVIQTVDSMRKLLKVDTAASEQNKKIQVLLQINISGEKQKGGMRPKDVEVLLKSITDLKSTKIMGCMCMGTHTDNEDLIKDEFRKIHLLFQLLEKKYPKVFEAKWLSMGMTNDFPLALEAGSNMIRIGTGIFGKRLSPSSEKEDYVPPAHLK